MGLLLLGKTSGGRQRVDYKTTLLLFLHSFFSLTMTCHRRRRHPCVFRRHRFHGWLYLLLLL